MNGQEKEYIKFKDVKISNVCYQHALNIIKATLDGNKKGYICLTDVCNVMTAAENEQLKTAINDSLLSLADGTPLAWYAWLTGCKEIERISGASLMARLFADMDGCRHFLLGDTDETIAKVISRAREINNRVDISGYSPPFRDFTADDNREMIELIRAVAPDIIWVSFGGLKQEKWMHQHFASLDKGVMVGVGAAFKFLIGEIITPPLIFQKMGLQWLFRLLQQYAKNPAACTKWVHQRKFVQSKFKFLANLPQEIVNARRTCN